MRARIAGIGDQLAQRPPGDGKIVHLFRTSQKGYESTCFCGRDFSGSAVERPDTPLLNFAGINRRRRDRSLPADLVDK
jgi:hypothetical protein